MAGEVDIPVSVPGLVSRQVLVMSYVDGLPITRAQVGPLALLGCSFLNLLHLVQSVMWCTGGLRGCLW